MDTTSILPILKKIPVFSDLSEAEHKEIIKNIVLNYYPAGHMFFHEGDRNPEDGMFIIKRGKVKISRALGAAGSGETKEVAALTDNDFFGEMALAQEAPRNATAACETDCEVFELKKSDFMALMQSSPTMATKISTELIEREKKNYNAT